MGRMDIVNLSKNKGCHNQQDNPDIIALHPMLRCCAAGRYFMGWLAGPAAAAALQ